MSVRRTLLFSLLLIGICESAIAEKFIVERVSKTAVANEAPLIGSESYLPPKLTQQEHNVVSRTRVDDTKLHFEVGTRWQFDSHSFARVAVENNKVLVARLLDTGKLLLVARRNGATKLHIWTKDGEQQEYAVKVTGSEYRSAILALSDEFGHSKNVEIFSANRFSGPMQTLLMQVMR